MKKKAKKKNCAYNLRYVRADPSARPAYWTIVVSGSLNPFSAYIFFFFWYSYDFVDVLVGYKKKDVM